MQNPRKERIGDILKIVSPYITWNLWRHVCSVYHTVCAEGGGKVENVTGKEKLLEKGKFFEEEKETASTRMQYS